LVTAIVEEYLPGDDLTAVAPPNDVLEFLMLAYLIAEGIADIHRHNRVHRDIKRQNMKFDAEGCLKIFDFGLARDIAVQPSTMGVLGTRGYMAPELFPEDSGQQVFFTPAVDTFAFAATLLAVILGSPPSGLRGQPRSFLVRRPTLRGWHYSCRARLLSCLIAVLILTRIVGLVWRW
jgi:serine/threonine-protein kinase